MCLEVLLPVDTYEEQGTGFKVFIENEFRTLEGVYRGLYQGLFCYKIGMEYNATECTLFDSYDPKIYVWIPYFCESRISNCNV